MWALGRDLVKDFITDEYKESVQEVLDNALKGQETGMVATKASSDMWARVVAVYVCMADPSRLTRLLGICWICED